MQKINRDTQRFAFKCSAQKKNTGQWIDIYKKPKDISKMSKKGRLALVKEEDGKYKTYELSEFKKLGSNNELLLVFKNGELLLDQNFTEVRKNADI